MLRDRGVGVVHVTHHLEDVLAADRAIVLDGGTLVFEGAPLELVEDLERAQALGVDVPPVITLARALREAGAPVAPQTLTAEGIVEALWRS
jgi:ABC-type multidrug transport system ATPase subunit